MMKKNQEKILLGLVLAAAVLLAANSLLFFGRLDLTENKAFTISEVSKNLFKDLPDRLTITYYVSGKLAKLSPIPGQIEDLLREYAAHGRGKIRVMVTDPAAGNQAQQIEKLGIVPQQIQVLEKNEQTVAVVYSGIVLSYLDSRETLPVVFDFASLEYDLTLRIKKLVKGESRTLGIVLGKKESSLQGDFQLLANSLSRYYTVKEVKRGEPVPADLTALFVLGGKDLEDYDLFPLDQYVMKGGKVLFAAEGVDVSLQANLKAEPLRDQPLLKLLAAYGVTVEPSLVLDSACRRIPVRKNSGPMIIQSMERYPHWVSIQGSGLSRKNPITARLSALDLLWPSPLKIQERPGLSAEVIASSSADSWLQRDRLMTNPYEAPAFKAFAADSAGKYPLAATLKGGFQSYFKGRPAPVRAGEKSPWAETVPASPETRLLVVGDSDFASDLMRYSESTYNLAFFENALDWLSSDDSMASIRTRTARDLRLSKIEDPKRKAGAILFAEVVNIGLVPLAVLAFGLLRSLRRREKAVLESEGAKS